MVKNLKNNISLEQIASGNEVEFEKFFKLYYSQLHRFAMFFVKTKVFADEVVMDVFYRLWNKRKDIVTIKNIDTYLYVSVRNISYSIIKNEKKYKFEDLDLFEVKTKRYTKTPENSIISQENLEEINNAIETLPPKCKLIFKLIREEKLKKKDVSEILNISVKTIDNQIAIAVRKIADVLDVDLSTKNYSAHIQAFLLFF